MLRISAKFSLPMQTLSKRLAANSFWSSRRQVGNGKPDEQTEKQSQSEKQSEPLKSDEQTEKQSQSGKQDEPLKSDAQTEKQSKPILPLNFFTLMFKSHADPENKDCSYLVMSFFGGGVAKTIKTAHPLPYYDPESPNAEMISPHFTKVILTGVKRGLLDKKHPVLLHIMDFDLREPQFKGEFKLVRICRQTMTSIVEEGSRPVRPVPHTWLDEYMERGVIPDL